MKALGRICALLIMAGWTAFWSGLLFLLWQPEYRSHIGLSGFSADADVASGGESRLIATVVSTLAIALVLPALGIVLGHTSAVAAGPEHGAIASSSGEPRILAHIPEDRAANRADAPVAPRPAVDTTAGLPMPVAGPPSNVGPATASSAAAPPVDVTALRDRLDRQEEEVRRLREALDSGGSTAAGADAQHRGANGRT